MKNLNGTEVISRAQAVVFFAGLTPARPVALQLALQLARGKLSSQTEDLRACALHAEARPASKTELVHMTNQIDAAADHNDRWHGPEDKYGHHILPNWTCRP
ncbi:hypothetical protein [Bradyrhizobium sp. LMG 9283]|uniref:hypothetical protein n=1 Tax=Bradyrhizobium sp. LMG 9283 TaxID=592064 RepID=UPI00388D0D1B